MSAASISASSKAAGPGRCFFAVGRGSGREGLGAGLIAGGNGSRRGGPEGFTGGGVAVRTSDASRGSRVVAGRGTRDVTAGSRGGGAPGRGAPVGRGGTVGAERRGTDEERGVAGDGRGGTDEDVDGLRGGCRVSPGTGSTSIGMVDCSSRYSPSAVNDSSRPSTSSSGDEAGGRFGSRGSVTGPPFRVCSAPRKTPVTGRTRVAARRAGAARP
jgi:hypothetical protein